MLVTLVSHFEWKMLQIDVTQWERKRHYNNRAALRLFSVWMFHKTRQPLAKFVSSIFLCLTEPSTVIAASCHRITWKSRDPVCLKFQYWWRNMNQLYEVIRALTAYPEKHRLANGAVFNWVAMLSLEQSSHSHRARWRNIWSQMCVEIQWACTCRCAINNNNPLYHCTQLSSVWAINQRLA